MSRGSRIAFLSAFLFLIVTFAVQFLTGAWINLNSILLSISGALIVVAIGLDWKLYLEFFTMRTTKHGMNMGVLILLVLTLVVCVNYLSVRHNKTWDVTKEKLNSLAPQTEELIKNLKNDLEIKVFYKGRDAEEERTKIKVNLMAYQSQSAKVKVRYINAYVDGPLAMQYLSTLPDRDQAAVVAFVENAGKKVRIEAPFDENQITSAMIKATRSGESKIYFLQGHGEKGLEDTQDQGLADLAKALGESSFKTEALNLIDKKEIPPDARVIAMIGPSVPYLDRELEWLRDYVKRGGRLLIALDPGQRSNAANLTKTLGIQFMNNYALTRSPVVGGGPATILGRAFDPQSDITRNFPAGSSFAVFPLASEVTVAQGKADKLDVKEIVRTDASSFTLTDPTKPLTAEPETRAVSVAAAVSGQLVDGKPFSAVVFGDSDFMSNRGILMGINRDLALNTFADLTDQKDLLSIKPKVPEGTLVMLSSGAKFSILILGMALPLILLITSGVLWFRRRGA